MLIGQDRERGRRGEGDARAVEARRCLESAGEGTPPNAQTAQDPSAVLIFAQADGLSIFQIRFDRESKRLFDAKSEDAN